MSVANLVDLDLGSVETGGAVVELWDDGCFSMPVGLAGLSWGGGAGAGDGEGAGSRLMGAAVGAGGSMVWSGSRRGGTVVLLGREAAVPVVGSVAIVSVVGVGWLLAEVLAVAELLG